MVKSSVFTLFFVLIGLIVSAQATRDDRFKKPNSKKQEYKAPLTPEEKAQKEFDALPDDQKKVLLEVGKEIQDEQNNKKKGGKTEVKSDSLSTKAPKKDDNKKKSAVDGKVEGPKKNSEKNKASAEKSSKSQDSKNAEEAKKSDKLAKEKNKDKISPEKEAGSASKKSSDEAPKELKDELPEKIQKPLKAKSKYSDLQRKEYSLYTERVSNDPDKADVAVALPKCSPEELNTVRLQKAVELITNRFGDKALSIMAELIKQDPKNANYNYWMGRAYFDAYNHQLNSIPYLAKAAEHTDYEYNFKYPERNALAPVDALFYLGKAHQKNQNWKLADRYLQLFSQVAKPDNPLRTEAQLSRKHVANAERSMSQLKRNVSVINLGAPINTPYADFAPHISSDGTELYFTSARPNNNPALAMNQPIDIENAKYFDDIYVSNLQADGKFGEAALISIDSANSDEQLCGISKDGKQLFLYRSDDNNFDFFRSTYNFGAWLRPQSLAPRNSTVDWGNYFSIDEEQTVIYFASNKLAGYGGYDLFYAYKKSDGRWSEPQNLGANINTPYDELSPFLHPNKRVLFYSSNNEESMGGFDVFRSNLLGEWQRGENMGAPINTVFDDLYFSMSHDGRSAFYSRNDDDGQGDLDIYLVNFFSNTAQSAPRLQASFKIDLKSPPGNKDNKAKATQPADSDLNEIVLTNVLTGERFVYTPNIRTGQFSVFLDPCTKYNIEYRKNGNIMRQEDFVAPCDLKETDKSVNYNPEGEQSFKRVNRAMPLVDKTEANLQGYGWQLQYKGMPVSDMAFQEIHYLKANGEILSTVKLDSQGLFPFEDIPGDQDYLFEIKLPDGKDCQHFKVVLTKDRIESGGVSYGVVCY